MTVCGPNGDIVVFETADIVRDVRLRGWILGSMQHHLADLSV
jgi:hypothetical protein